MAKPVGPKLASSRFAEARDTDVHVLWEIHDIAFTTTKIGGAGTLVVNKEGKMSVYGLANGTWMFVIDETPNVTVTVGTVNLSHTIPFANFNIDEVLGVPSTATGPVGGLLAVGVGYKLGAPTDNTPQALAWVMTFFPAVDASNHSIALRETADNSVNQVNIIGADYDLYTVGTVMGMTGPLYLKR